MADSRKAIGLVVALMIAALLSAFLFPVAMTAMTGPEVATATLDTGNSTDLQSDLSVTLDSVDDTADTATYTINASGETAEVTVDNGTSETTTVDGADVTISVTDVTASSATAEFDSPTTYSWGGGAGALWGILPVILVLALFLFFTYLAVKEL